MPEYCKCGNILDDAERLAKMRIVSSPCRCPEPAAFVVRRTRVAPVDLHQPSDPARRRLGLPSLTPLEKAHIPRDKWDLHE